MFCEASSLPKELTSLFITVRRFDASLNLNNNCLAFSEPFSADNISDKLAASKYVCTISSFSIDDFKNSSIFSTGLS